MEQETATWGGSRRLLRRLREMMAGPGSAQERLDRIATLIANEMIAEVCSVYVRRAGEVLELFATEGLRKDAVHKTRLQIGEGLVGDVAAHARALALADAQSHPQFAYRPETGEEIYHSLMGVPILRGGRVLGVLVVQNRTQRHYAEEEIETLETIAMVLAELVAGGELVDPDEVRPEEDLELLPERVEGVSLCPGLAAGTAVLHQSQVVVDSHLAEDAETELQRVGAAMAQMQIQLDAILKRPELTHGGEHRDILETYLMFARDRGWRRRIEEAIASGLTAEAAVKKVRDDSHERMATVSDPYLRERLLDLEDLTNRLLQHLTGSGTFATGELPRDTVLFARTMGPAELLNYERARLKALVLEEGSATAHVTIVARALDIPLVGRAAGVLSRVETGDPVLVDADKGEVYMRPSDEVHENFARILAAHDERQRSYAALRSLPAVTRDGAGVSLHLNAGLLADMRHIHETGADGVGLYRTEIPFMVRASYPDVAAQTELYSGVLDDAGGKPVVFRTLDVGGDKLLPYFGEAGEANPAMGWRAMRIALDRPAMLRNQLRALLAASHGRELNVMFPMVAEVAEFEAARAILDMEIERAGRRGSPLPRAIRVGLMLEIPALAWQLPALLPRVDFLSVGSNDLIQFMFASDRGNPRLERRYDTLSPPVLTFLADLVARCAAADVPLALCGEMAGQPLEAMTLVGLGFRSLSMAPASVGPVKAMTRSLDAGSLAAYVDRLKALPVHSVRARLRAFAQDHDVVLPRA
ncbi:MAG: phosphoenolpyruvate--protein phosphotransferase [Alphaproteobacteria bacterium]